MKKSKKLSSRIIKQRAVIYCNENWAGKACKECLDLAEKCCREYCALENLKVVRVFRERSKSPNTPTRLNEMVRFIEQHDEEISYVVHALHSAKGRTAVKIHLRKASKKASS